MIPMPIKPDTAAVRAPGTTPCETTTRLRVVEPPRPKPDIRAATAASWARNKEAYLYLGR